MPEPKVTLTEAVNAALEAEPDLTQLHDEKHKQEFFSRIEKKYPYLKKESIKATYSKVIGKHAEAKGQPPDNFHKKKPKKFSGALDISTNLEKKENVESGQQKPLGGGLKQPMQGQVIAQEPLPMKAVAGSAHAFLSAIVTDLEELTDSEKEDVGTCLNMLFGDWLSGHDEARKILGAVGLMGIYGSKIRKARKKKREREEKEEKEEKRLSEKITPQLQNEFTEKVNDQFHQKEMQWEPEI